MFKKFFDLISNTSTCRIKVKQFFNRDKEAMKEILKKNFAFVHLKK